MARIALTCVAAALLTSATACGGALLSWRAQPPAPTLTGKAVVAVADRRVGPQGGDDPTLVGSEHGVLLIPHALRLAEPTDAANTIRDLVAQAALTAGIAVAPAGGGGAQIAVDIQNMWCDGVAMAYTKARLSATLEVHGPDGAVRVPPILIQVEGGGGNCRDAYEHMLTNVYSHVTGLLSQPTVKAAVNP